MNKHIWRVVGGLIRVALVYLPIKLIIFIVSQFDDFWNVALWQKLWQKDFVVLGFLFSLGIFYFVGFLTETRLLKWLDWLLGKVPVLGPLLTSFNPRTRELLKKSKGVIIANFNTGYQVAVLTAVHNTKEGYLGSVLYGTFPPTRQLLNEKSRIYVLEIMDENGGKRYEMIPARVALQQELSSGMTVPAEAYENAVEISFGEFVRSGALLNNNADA